MVVHAVALAGLVVQSGDLLNLLEDLGWHESRVLAPVLDPSVGRILFFASAEHRLIAFVSHLTGIP
jgi:hypothetical protein